MVNAFNVGVSHWEWREWKNGEGEYQETKNNEGVGNWGRNEREIPIDGGRDKNSTFALMTIIWTEGKLKHLPKIQMLGRLDQ